MIFKRLSPRERRLFAWTSTVLGVAVGYNLILEPLWTQLNRSRQEMETETMQLKKYRRLLAEKEKFKKEFEAVAQQSKMTGSEQEAMTQFMSQVEQMAALSGLPLKGLRPRPVSSLGKFRLFVVEIQADGAIGPITRFLHALESSPSLIKLDRLQLGVKGGPSGQIEAQMAVSLLQFPPSS